MKFKGFGTPPSKGEPANYMVLIDNALKKGDQKSIDKLTKLMNQKNNSLIRKCVSTYQNNAWDEYALTEGSTFIHSDDYVPMKCCLCGAHMESIHDTHNPAPLAPHCYAKAALEDDLPHRCCGRCNHKKVTPARYLNASGDSFYSLDSIGGV